MFEKSESAILDLRFNILDCMADDAEDVEQIYLCLNRGAFEKNSLQPACYLRDVIDVMMSLFADHMIEATQSNDETGAPLGNLNRGMFHHYWFAPTEEGLRWWKSRRDELDKQK